MAAIAYPDYPQRARPRRPELIAATPAPDVVVPTTARRSCLEARVYRRRRVGAALAVAVSAICLGTVAVGAHGLLTGEPPGRHAQPQHVVYVVQPGDTLWAIARRLQPTGDVRPLVARLAAQRHGQPLEVGQSVSLP